MNAKESIQFSNIDESINEIIQSSSKNVFTTTCVDEDIMDGKLPTWECFRTLQKNINAWCYLNFHYLPPVVGKCMWVCSIQRRSKLRSLITPSDKAFCLLVLKNNWDLWIWECENPGATLTYKNSHAPTVLYTSTGIGRRTEVYGGWSSDGILLYNTLVKELTTTRKK